MKRMLVLTVLIGAVGLTAVAAQAKVPHFGPKTIVPGKSIGGVQVGMTKAQAYTAWRTPDRCDPAGRGVLWCQYLAVSTLSNGFKVNQPFAGFYLRSGRVVAVGLEFAENAAVDPKVRQIKSSKGIHVGSTMAAALKAYKIKRAGPGEAGQSRAILKQRGNRCTLFYAPTSPYSKIEAIQVGICNAAGLV
jgi:hypothetical protein